MPLSRSDQPRVDGGESRSPKTNKGPEHTRRKPRAALKPEEPPRYAVNAIVLSNEDLAAFEELVAHYVRRIRPIDQVEYHLACELAASTWRLTRNRALETRLLDHEMALQLPALNAAGLSIGELTRLLNASQSTIERSQYASHLARREAQLMRARNSTLSFLLALRKNFPLSDPAPQIIPRQTLNPELPHPNEPKPCGADPLVRAEPPGSAACGEVTPKRVSAASEQCPPGQRRATDSVRAMSAIPHRQGFPRKSFSTNLINQNIVAQTEQERTQIP